MIRKITIIIATFLSVIFCYEFVSALETTTHRLINLKIANSKIGEFSLNDYLIKNLSILNGVKNNFEGRRAEIWIELGGLYEDKPESSMPYRRSVNHYHNPLTDKGYSGFFWGCFCQEILRSIGPRNL